MYDVDFKRAFVNIYKDSNFELKPVLGHDIQKSLSTLNFDI